MPNLVQPENSRYTKMPMADDQACTRLAGMQVNKSWFRQPGTSRCSYRKDITNNVHIKKEMCIRDRIFIENAPAGITVTPLDSLISVISFAENAPSPSSVTVSGRIASTRSLP